MYTSFHIKNFRGFEDLTIGPLDRVNLIAGKNNVGKSSLLEALWIHHSPDNPEVLLRTHIHRGLSDIDQLEMISGLFYNFDRLRAIELLASGEWSDTTRHLQVSLKEREVIQLTFTEPESEQSSLDQDSPLDPWLADHEIVLLYTDEYGNRLVTRGHAEVLRIGSRFPRMVFDISRQRGLRRSAAIYLTARQRSSQREDSRRLGQVELARKDKDVVEILKDIEPRLTKLTTISLRSGPVIFGDIGLPELVPISLMGDGMVRLLSLALAIASARDGIVLIDEIENGFHYSIMPKVWQAIASFSRQFNVQVFATTHSYECIQAAHEAFEADSVYDFRLHRLERVKGKIKAITYSQGALNASLEADWEVR